MIAKFIAKKRGHIINFPQFGKHRKIPGHASYATHLSPSIQPVHYLLQMEETITDERLQMTDKTHTHTHTCLRAFCPGLPR